MESRRTLHGFSSIYGICCCCYMFTLCVSSPSSSPLAVNVGALVDMKNSTFGTVTIKALRLAVENVNNAHILPNGSQLNLEIMNSGCDPIQGAASALKLMKKEVAAILGPQSSVVAHFVAHIGRAAQVPILSFGATDPNLSEDQYSYFFRVAPSDAKQMDAVAAFIASFNWKEVVAIYTDDDYGANGVSQLSQALQRRGSRLVDRTKISIESNATEIRSKLTRLENMESRVFVLHTQQALGFRILMEAYNLRMISTGYVWIVTDMVAMGLVSPDLDPAFAALLQGLVGMRRYIISSSRVHNLLTQWEKKYPGDMQSFNISSFNTYGLYAYDSVFMIVQAISSYLAQGYNLTFMDYYESHPDFVGGTEFQHMKVLQSGPALIDALLGVTFSGTSGFIEFNEAGDIKDVAYEYINMLGRNTSVVAYWTSGNNVSNSPPEFVDNSLVIKNHTGFNTTNVSIVWPGGGTERPRGWVPPKNGQPLRVGVPKKAGYYELINQFTDSNNVTQYDGFCIMVFEIAKKNLDYPVIVEYIPLTSTIIGKTNPVYDDLIHRIATGELDAAVGDVTITSDRLKLVDFTQPYIESGLVVLVARIDKHANDRWAFLRPLTATMWVMILGFTFFIGFVIWVLEHEDNPEFHGTTKEQFAVVLWFMFSTWFTAHREGTKNFLCRIVLILWLFVVLILTSSYTASLTAILTVQQLTPGIQGLESLIRSNVPIGYQTGSFVRDYLVGLKVNPDRLKDYASLDSYKTALDLGPHRGGVAAIVDELPYVQLFLESNCMKYGIAGSVFTKSGWGFAFPRGSGIAADLSTEILSMSQSGQLQQIHDYWFKGQQCDEAGASVQEQSNQLGIESFWVLFVIMGITAIACCGVHHLMQSWVFDGIKNRLTRSRRRGG